MTRPRRRKVASDAAVNGVPVTTADVSEEAFADRFNELAAQADANGLGGG